MLAPKGSTYNGRPTFANPTYLKKAQSEKPYLYEIPYDTSDLANIFDPDREETLTLEQESRLNSEEILPPRGQYDFVDTIEVGQGLIRSPSHDARTIARAADKAEDVGYVRALQTSEYRMMTSIEEVNLRVSYQAQVPRQESKDFYTQLHDARTDRRDIRLEIDVVRRQRTTYETELHEVRQAYLSSEAQNRALLALLETLETHISRMEWQRQRVEDDAVRQIMRTQVLEARS
ncbi:hypothetical protein Tco_0984735 [Tanacetum coccineum]